MLAGHTSVASRICAVVTALFKHFLPCFMLAGRGHQARVGPGRQRHHGEQALILLAGSSPSCALTCCLAVLAAVSKAWPMWGSNPLGVFGRLPDGMDRHELKRLPWLP